MHQSFFSYNVTRPYPFKWFTPVVVIGGIITIALASFINFASTGYELVTISSNNPNATVDDPSQYGGIRWPSYFVGSTRASCAPTTLPLNTLIYTQKNAIPYTLKRVWRTKDNGNEVNLGSLVYHNNMLRGCDVTEVTIDVVGTNKESPKVTALSQAVLSIGALAECSVDIDTLQTESAQGPTYFQLSGTYKLIGPEANNTFLSRNETESASLYWGESMLNMYYLLTARSYIDGAADEWRKSKAYNAAITLKRGAKGNGTDEEIMSNGFFKVDCYTEASFCDPHGTSINALAAPDPKKEWKPYPKIWHHVNLLGKAMWHTVLTDLGSNGSMVPMPNMLTRPNLLANLTGNLTNEVNWYRDAKDKVPSGLKIHQNIETRLALKTFDPNSNAKLEATPAYLSTNYICQVPRTKAPGTLFFSILVADLVLLQAVWIVFRYIVDRFLEHKYSRNNMELVDLRKSSSTMPLVAPGSPHGYPARDE